MMNEKVDKKLKSLLFVSLILFQFAFLEQCEVPETGKLPLEISLETKESYVLTEAAKIRALVKNPGTRGVPVRTTLSIELPDATEQMIYEESFNLEANQTRAVTKTYPLALESQTGSYKLKVKVLNLETNGTKETEKGFQVTPPVRFASVEHSGILNPGGNVKFNLTLANKAAQTIDSLRLNGTFDTAGFKPISKEKLVSIGAEMSKLFTFSHQIRNLVGTATYRANLYYKENLWDRIQTPIQVKKPIELDKLTLTNETIELGETQSLSLAFSSQTSLDYPYSILVVRFRIGPRVKERRDLVLGKIEAYSTFNQSISWDTTETIEGRHHIDAWIKSSDLIIYNGTDIGSFVVKG